MKLSLCIPMYNESKIISETAKTLSDYMERNFAADGYEIIFSDDGSTDKCADIVNGLGLPNVRTVGYPENKGKGYAVRTAVMAAEGELIMFTDADLAYGTDIIKVMAEALASSPEAQMVIGSRNISDDGYEGYTAVRKLASKAYIKVLGVIGGLKLSDSQCGCKIYRAGAAKDIFSKCKVNGFAFDFETILRAEKAGFKIKEVPVRVVNHRESKVNVLRDSVKMLKDLKKIKKDIRNESKK